MLMLIYGALIDRQPLGHRPRQEVRERGMGRDLDVWVLWQSVAGRGCVCVEAGYQVSLAFPQDFAHRYKAAEGW